MDKKIVIIPTYNEKENIENLKTQQYPYEVSVYYVDEIDEYEHFADYAINVVEALTQMKH